MYMFPLVGQHRNSRGCSGVSQARRSNLMLTRIPISTSDRNSWVYLVHVHVHVTCALGALGALGALVLV